MQLANYDYIMRLDTDSFLLAPVESDVIADTGGKLCAWRALLLFL